MISNRKYSKVLQLSMHSMTFQKSCSFARRNLKAVILVVMCNFGLCSTYEKTSRISSSLNIILIRWMHLSTPSVSLNSWSISQSTTSTYRFWVRGIRWWVGPRGSQNHGLNFPAQLSCWEIKVFDFFLQMAKIFIVWRADVWIEFSQQLSIVHEQTIYHLKDLGARISSMVLILLWGYSVLRNGKKRDLYVKLRIH